MVSGEWGWPETLAHPPVRPDVPRLQEPAAAAAPQETASAVHMPATAHVQATPLPHKPSRCNSHAASPQRAADHRSWQPLQRHRERRQPTTRVNIAASPPIVVPCEPPRAAAATAASRHPTMLPPELSQIRRQRYRICRRLTGRPPCRHSSTPANANSPT